MTYKWKNSSLANGPKKGGTTKQSTTEDKDGDNSDSSSDQNDILTWRPSFALHTNERHYVCFYHMAIPQEILMIVCLYQVHVSFKK
jgi:hypothetical protein